MTHGGSSAWIVTVNALYRLCWQSRCSHGKSTRIDLRMTRLSTGGSEPQTSKLACERRICAPGRRGSLSWARARGRDCESRTL